MKTIAAVIAFVMSGALLWTSEPAQKLTAVKASDVKWEEAKGHPKGVKSALIHGDPAKGAFVMLLRIPAGTVYPPHLHSADEVVFVQSGTWTIGEGEKVDESKGKMVDAGGYFSFGAKTPHWGKTNVYTVVLRYANGASDIIYCNPADDPSKKQ